MATLTTAANALKVIVDSPVVKGFFANDEFFGLFSPTKSPPGSTYNWTLETAGTTGAAAVEGAPYLAIASNAYARPSLAYQLFQDTVGVTKHLQAALLGGDSAAYFDEWQQEISDGLMGVKQAAMTVMLGAAGQGIQLAIAAAGVYAAQNHGAVAGWPSYAAAVGGPLTYIALDTMREALRDVPARSHPNLILAPENQVHRYTRLSGPGVRNSFTNMIPNGSMPNSDIGENVDLPHYGGIPVVGVGGMLTTIMFMLDKSVMRLFYHETTAGDGGWEVVEIPKGGFRQDLNLSWFGTLVCREPMKCGTLTTLTP